MKKGLIKEILRRITKNYLRNVSLDRKKNIRPRETLPSGYVMVKRSRNNVV